MIRNPGKTGFLPSSESGYTILEGLMAVVVVAVLVSAIGPVIAFSVGTRVQAKRVELATQAARTYIDGVKSGAIPVPTLDSKKVNDRDAPTGGTLSCNTTTNLCNSVTDLYCVDFDGGGCLNTSPVDMVVQGLAYHPSPSQTSTTQSYVLGVRVYRANSFASGVTLTKPTSNKSVDSLTTNSLGNRSLPLVQMSTEVLPKDARLQDHIKYRVQTPSPPSP